MRPANYLLLARRSFVDGGGGAGVASTRLCEGACACRCARSKQALERSSAARSAPLFILWRPQAARSPLDDCSDVIRRAHWTPRRVRIPSALAAAPKQNVIEPEAIASASERQVSRRRRRCRRRTREPSRFRRLGGHCVLRRGRNRLPLVARALCVGSSSETSDRITSARVRPLSGRRAVVLVGGGGRCLSR